MADDNRDDNRIEVNIVVRGSVYSAITRLIQRRFNAVEGRAVISESDLVREIAEEMGVSEDEVYRRKYLRLVEVYRRSGWDVGEDTEGEGGGSVFVFVPATLGEDDHE